MSDEFWASFVRDPDSHLFLKKDIKDVSNNRWRYHAAKRRQFAAMYGTGRSKEVPLHADYSAIEQRILAHMSMSRDRVHFDVSADNTQNAYFRDAFERAFGTEPPAMDCMSTAKVTIVCRPSQFARFLIYRNNFGGRNSFKELNPRLVEPAEAKFVDVSTNPRRG